MTCSSATRGPTNTSHAIVSAVPNPRGFRKFVLAPLVGMVLWLERRRQYGELLELDDRLLADLGLSKTVVEEVRRSSLYLDAWRDSR